MMSDRQRRTICRAVFCGCLGATVGVIYFLAHRPTTRDWEAQLRSMLGVTITLDSVSTPDPGQTLLKGLTIAEPDLAFASRIAHLRLLHGPTLQVAVDQQLGLTSRSLALWVERLRTQVDRQPSAAGKMKLRISRLTVYREHDQVTGDSLAFGPVELDIHCGDGGAEVRATLYFVDLPASGPMRMTWKRERVGGQSLDTLVWESREVAVPLWLAAELVGDLRMLGPPCRFVGGLSLAGGPSTWSGTVAGQMQRIDLATLSTGWTGTVDGQATANFHATIAEGRIASIEAAVECQRGRIDGQLYAELCAWLGQEPVDARDATRGVAFSQARFDFALHHGLLEVLNSGPIAVDSQHRPVLAVRSPPSRSLVEFLVGHSDAAWTNDTMRTLDRFLLPARDRQAQRASPPGPQR